MIEVSSESERQFSQDSQDRSVEEVVVSGDKWTIRVVHNIKEESLEFSAEEHATLDIYATSFHSYSMPKELEFYEDVKTIYEYIASDPSKRLEFNQLGRYILLIDKIANKMKMTQIPLIKKDIDILDLKDIKIRQLEAECTKLRKEKGRLKYNTDQWSKKQRSLKDKIKSLEQQNGNLANRIKRLEYKAELWRNERKVLQKRCLMFPENHEQEVQYLQRRIKIRKINSGNILQKTISKNNQKSHIYGSQSGQISSGKQEKQLLKYSNKIQHYGSTFPTLIKNQEKESQNINSSDIELIEINPDESIILEQKLKFTIPIQPNSHNFAVALPTIKKISSSEHSQMFYFISDQCIKDSLSRASRVFVSFQNISEEQQIQLEKFRFIVGVISSSCVNLKSAQNCKKAIYFNSSQSTISQMGKSFPVNTVTFGFQDIINFILDFDQEQIQWYLNNKIIAKTGLDYLIWQQGIHPFIELKSANSKIEIL